MTDHCTWPYDDSYSYKCCACGSQYSGPRHSPECWDCTPQYIKDWWNNENTPKEEKL